MARHEQLGLFDRGYQQGYRDAEKDNAPTGGGKTMARKARRRRSAVGRKIRAGAKARSQGKKGRKKGRKRTTSAKGLAGRVSRLEKNVGGVDCKALERRVGNVESWTLRTANVLRKHAGRPALKSLSGSPSKGIPARGKGF